MLRSFTVLLCVASCSAFSSMSSPMLRLRTTSASPMALKMATRLDGGNKFANSALVAAIAVSTLAGMPVTEVGAFVDTQVFDNKQFKNNGILV